MLERYRHPIRFYVYSALIPWALWIAAAYLSRLPNAEDHGLCISSLGLVGLGAPLLVALRYIRKDRALLADVLARFTNFRSGRPIHQVTALALMPASILLAMAISLLFGYDSSQFIISGKATFTSFVLPVWFLLAVAPVLEELAWHSYGTDCLRQRFSLFTSSMIFACYWALWHIPLAFIDGYYHSNLVVEGALHGINFLASIFPFVLLMNWLYYRTGRNILVAVVLHLEANVFNEIFATHPDSKIIQTLLLSALAGYLLFTERDFFFDREYRPGDPREANREARSDPMRHGRAIAQLLSACFIIAIPAMAHADNLDADEDAQLVPLAQFEYVSLHSQQVLSTSVGLHAESSESTFTGLYTYYVFEQPLLDDYPSVYHGIDTLYERKRDRHQYIGIFKSESDQPVSGGLQTFQAGMVYGYELIRDPGLSLVLGGGIAIGDFGIETSDGDIWPVIPVPLVRVDYSTDFLDATFEFLTSPNLSFTLAPRSRVRVAGDFRMDQFRDSRDVIFECDLVYRFFSAEHEYGDVAGMSVGFKNDNVGAFGLGGDTNEEDVELHYNAVLAAIDISVLKLTAGYAFNGRALYRETLREELGEGYFVSVQAMYAF